MEKAGKRVLVIDCDPQANATLGLGINPAQVQRNMYDVFLSGIEGFETVTIPDIITKTESGIFLAPSTLDLVGAEPFLYEKENRITILREALNGLDTQYDFILIDTPPSLGQFVINGLVAADHCIVTLDAGTFAQYGIEALTTIFSDIRESSGREIHADMILLTRWSDSVPENAESASQPEPDLITKIRKLFSPKPLKPTPEEIQKRDRDKREQERLDAIEINMSQRFKTVFKIPYTPDIYEAQKRGLPISHFAPESKAAQCYKDITDEVLKWK